MFRKMMVGLVVAVVVMGTQVEAKAEVKVLTSITGAGVMPGFTVKTGFIHPVSGYYPYPAVYPGYPVAYPVYPAVYPAVYPTYPAYYPMPVVAPIMPVVAPSYTVLYRASVYHAWTIHSSHPSHAGAHATASGLVSVGYFTKISY